MSTKEKTIIAPISLVVKHGEEPIEAGTPLTLPTDEADSIIERFGAVEVEKETKAKGRAKADTDD